MRKTLFAITLSCALIAIANSAVAADGPLRHVVAFKFKEDASPDQIKKVEGAFCDLKKRIPQIKSLEWGTNVSKENLGKGFTHCFFVTFKSEKDCEAYVRHPDHQAFVEILKPIMADAFVFDYLAKK